jgi:hypothetical protein
VKKAGNAKKPTGLTSAIGPKATVVVVILVMAGGIAIAARQQQVKSKDGQPVMTADVAAESTDALSKHAPTPVVSTAISGVALAPTATHAGMSPAASHSVSVTGCLEKTDDGFRLTDTAGPAAPKSRSWKSGFLKKGTATVDVVEASHALQLGSQVGHRVTVTGALVDREMRADSVHRVATSCKAN